MRWLCPERLQYKRNLIGWKRYLFNDSLPGKILQSAELLPWHRCRHRRRLLEMSMGAISFVFHPFPSFLPIPSPLFFSPSPFLLSSLHPLSSFPLPSLFSPLSLPFLFPSPLPPPLKHSWGTWGSAVYSSLSVCTTDADGIENNGVASPPPQFWLYDDRPHGVGDHGRHIQFLSGDTNKTARTVTYK